MLHAHDSSDKGDSSMIAAISDVHSNLEALKGVLAKVTRADMILDAGDVVGYNAKPNGCIALFKKHRIRSVLGNHDQSCITGDTGNMNPVAAQAIDWTRKTLSGTSMRYLKRLPEKLELSIKGRRIVVMHGSPMDPMNDYVFPWASERVLERYLDMEEADILILGNTHVPFVNKLGDRLVVNPGSVGQPRDHGTESSHAVIDPVRLEASILRTKYDIIRVSNEITGAGLPVFLAERLFQGL
ncbi:MAG: YfcE family phosphodiesterase [Candidatus Aenigmarchaeota archaeon]|nr:YfcE family phosphodiesterase [Candidatus Aenigmarchaeota archaeon]